MLFFFSPRPAMPPRPLHRYPASSRNATLPILSNVLIEKKGDALTLLATDIEIQIRNRTTAAVGADDVAITVGARKLQDILRPARHRRRQPSPSTTSASPSRPAEPLPAADPPAADYPRLAPPEGEGSPSPPPRRPSKQLAQVQYAMAQQDIRYYLNGLLLVVWPATCCAWSPPTATASPTPPRRWSATYARTDVILPRKTVVELARQLADSDDALEVTIVGNQIVFRFGHIELISKLIDGKFPDYERVIPRATPSSSRPAAWRCCSRPARRHPHQRKFRGVRLMLSEGSPKWCPPTPSREEAQEELEVDYSGDALDIGFNVTYLPRRAQQPVRQRNRDPLQRRQRQRPLRPADDPDFKYVVMPMRI